MKNIETTKCTNCNNIVKYDVDQVEEEYISPVFGFAIILDCDICKYEVFIPTG